jgi:hypothetical protein
LRKTSRVTDDGARLLLLADNRPIHVWIHGGGPYDFGDPNNYAIRLYGVEAHAPHGGVVWGVQRGFVGDVPRAVFVGARSGTRRKRLMTHGSAERMGPTRTGRRAVGIPLGGPPAACLSTGRGQLTRGGGFPYCEDAEPYGGGGAAWLFWGDLDGREEDHKPCGLPYCRERGELFQRRLRTATDLVILYCLFKRCGHRHLGLTSSLPLPSARVSHRWACTCSSAATSTCSA